MAKKYTKVLPKTIDKCKRPLLRFLIGANRMIRLGQELTSKWELGCDGKPRHGVVVAFWPGALLPLVRWDDGDQDYVDPSDVTTPRKPPQPPQRTPGCTRA